MKLHNYTQVDIFKKAYQKDDGCEDEQILNQSNNVVSVPKGPTQHAQFNPYTNNYGTTIGKYPNIFNWFWNWIIEFLLTKFIVVQLSPAQIFV